MKVFKEKQWFDFEKLTLFTGTNNSGKSSVINGMQMLQESIKAKDLEELLKTKIEIKSNQNKHGNLRNFVNNESKIKNANKFGFELQKGNIIYTVIVEINDGLQSYGVVKAIIASDKRSQEKIFHLIPVDLENQFECEFRINYKYFLDSFYQKCENTIKLKERTVQLDKLVKLVEKDKADIEELRVLADKISKEFSVYININYCHYTDPDFDMMAGITINFGSGKEEENGSRKKKEKTSIVRYKIEEYDCHGQSPNQFIEELGVLFDEGEITRVGKSNFPFKSQPTLCSNKKIDSIYTNSTKLGIFDFSFLWKDDEAFKTSFEELICSYYNANFKTANRQLSDDLIVVVSSRGWNMKETYSNMDALLVPAKLLKEYFFSLPYFGLITGMFTNRGGNSFSFHQNINAKTALYDKNEAIEKLLEQDFFKKVFDKLSDLIMKFIKQQIDKSSELDEEYSIYASKEPIVQEEVYDAIMADIMQKILNVNLCYNNDYVSSNRFAVNRSYNFSDNTDFSKLLKQIENLNEEERKTCNGFINKWIKAFGIADQLILKPDSDTGNFKAFLKTKNIETSLADFGLGTNQLLPVIFVLGINKVNSNYGLNLESNEYDPRTVVFEEPEANLHPALQSKLADMFVDAIQTFNVQIIAETHSEYLIRRLQYLTAKHYFEPKNERAISPDDSVIYYFNDDKNVNKKEPKVVKIKITENGNLTDTFGKGFFDESTQLQFELLKLNKEQNN